MSTVLYEADKFKFPFWLLLIFLCFFSLFFFLIKRKCSEDPESRSSKITMRIVSIVCIVGTINITLLFSIALFGQLHMYNHTVSEYKAGNYQVAEGYVAYFTPEPDNGKTDEHFELDGVYFDYSSSSLEQGYSKPRFKGGVITGDGQHLRVKYVYYNETYGNVIMCIEELE